MNVLSDTRPSARTLHEDLLRRKTPEESFEIARGLTRSVQMVAFDSVRQRHPELSDDEVWLKLAAERLGAEVVRKVYERRTKRP